jgi:hypothetical protein
LRGFVRGGVTIAACLLFAWRAVPAQVAPDEIPVTLGESENAPLSRNSIAALGEDPTHRLIINGFAVASYGADLGSKENSFNDDALALSIFKLLSDRVTLFTQLTTSREAASPFLADVGAPREISTDIDNLMLTFRPSPASGLDITVGKFDSPLAIERDDAPLNFQATSSFTFDLTRPVKFTGVEAHVAFSPALEGWAAVSNGWDVDVNNNRGVTGAAYGLWSPSMGTHIGLGVIMGSEKDSTSKGSRTAVVGTLLLQPATHLVVGGEAVAGQEGFAAVNGGTARWYGGMLFTHYRFAGHWAGTVRLDSVDDRDGARSGTPQRLQSATLSPQYLIGGSFFGIFRYLDRTTLRLPELAIRLDLRYDHSTQPSFVSGIAGAGSHDDRSATIQTVVIF